ncbi:MAG: hypothetical protein FWG10_13845 [Eubacteriaceae bacterium]|nr:hypothetical protein [Eubacteriaceae bacterium]
MQKKTQEVLCVPQRDIARVVQLASSGTIQQKRLFFSDVDIEATIDFFAQGMSTIVQERQKLWFT